MNRQFRGLDVRALKQISDCLAVAFENGFGNDGVGGAVVNFYPDGCVVVEVTEVGVFCGLGYGGVEGWVVGFGDGVFCGEVGQDAC